jgi:hypothetical protein
MRRRFSWGGLRQKYEKGASQEDFSCLLPLRHALCGAVEFRYSGGRQSSEKPNRGKR